MGSPEQQFAFRKNIPVSLPDTQKSSDIDMVHAGEWTVSIPLAVSIVDHNVTHEVLIASGPQFNAAVQDAKEILNGVNPHLAILFRPQPRIGILNSTRETRGRRNSRTGKMYDKTYIVG